jgi:shikimate kinase
MSDAGKIICLTAKPEILLQRLKGHAKAAGEKAARPMLLSGYPLARIRRLLSERESSYSKSDLVVNTEFLEPEAVAKKIIERLSL